MKSSLALKVALLIVLLGCSRFDSDTWKDHCDESETNNPRWEMVDDLQKKLSTDCMTEDELILLLGNPTYRQESDKETFLYYTVGWRFAFAIDPDFLVIKLNEKSIYAGSWVEQQ